MDPEETIGRHLEDLARYLEQPEERRVRSTDYPLPYGFILEGIRPEIALSQHNGTTTVAFARMDHPKVIPSEYTKRLLREQDVGVAPGYTFVLWNDQKIRLCFSQSCKKLQLGLDRIVSFVERYDHP
jgi:aspartate/methionine/tyrosine aminotransferase